MKIAWSMIIMLVLLSACSLAPDSKQVIAQVDDEKLTLAEFQANFSPEQYKNLTPEQKREYVQQWVDMVLLSREARKEGMDKDKAVKNKLKYAQDKVLGNALIATRLAAEKVSEEELFNYYRIHQGDFAQPLMDYKVQRIYLIDSNSVTKVRQEIENGMKFEDAAKVYSQEQMGQTGGFMGTVSPNGPDSTIWLAVHSLPLLEMTTLKTANGYYLLRSYEQQPGIGQSGFEGQKDEIQRRILDERKKTVYDDLLKELKGKSDIYLSI